MGAQLQIWNDHFNDLWKRHRRLIVLLIAGLIFDTLTTIHFMKTDGIDLEIHPIIRYSATLSGPIVGTILSAFVYKAIICLILAIYLKANPAVDIACAHNHIYF